MSNHYEPTLGHFVLLPGDKKAYCPHCKKEVTRGKDKVSKGYFAACEHCDEDFYQFELIIK